MVKSFIQDWLAWILHWWERGSGGVMGLEGTGWSECVVVRSILEGKLGP